jgi:hypothetical protein
MQHPDLLRRPVGPVFLVFLVAVMFAAAACQDPVREQAIAALGPETAEVGPGPLHRPGQPCLLCHDSTGGRRPDFSVAGTVYALADGDTPLNQIEVRMIDADRRPFTALTNCAGNFYVAPVEYSPHYPLWVTLAAEGQTIDMESPVYRDGSCATCHTDPKSPSSAGRVFLLVDAGDTLPPAHYCR